MHKDIMAVVRRLGIERNPNPSVPELSPMYVPMFRYFALRQEEGIGPFQSAL